MEGDRTVPGGHWQEDDIQQATSGQLAADTHEPCLETFVDRREQTIVIDSRSGYQVFRRLDSHAFHRGHTGNIPDDLGTNKLAYTTALKSSSEGGTADLLSEQGLCTSPERSSITVVLLGTPVDEERDSCQNNGRGQIFIDTRQNTSDQEKWDMGSRLPAQIHYRDKGTCTMPITKSADQTDAISWALDSHTTAHVAEATQPITCADTRRISNDDELSDYLPSCNNTHIVSRFDRSCGTDDDGRRNQVSLRLLERRKTIEVDKDDLSGLEVRHTSNLNFSISSQEQLRHHSVMSEVNIVWGKTIDAEEICSKERLFRSELLLNPFLNRSFDDCTDYFSADMSSDTMVTSDCTDSFVETGDSMYASDCNDSFLEQTDICPDTTDTTSDLSPWKHEQFTNNRDHRDAPGLVSTLYTDLTHACDIELRDRINQKQQEISLVDDVVEHPFDRKLLYKVSDIVANLGRGASDVEIAAKGMFHGDCVAGVDQTDISYHLDQDSCLPILHDQISNSPHSRDDIHNCDAVDGEMQKSGLVVGVGVIGQSQEDIRHIQFDGNPKVGLRVSKDLPHLQLADSSIIHTNVAADDSWNNTGDDADTVGDTDPVVNATRQSQEDLPSVQLGESVILTDSSMRDATSLNRVDINNLLLLQNSSDADVHCFLDGNSEVCNKNENIHEPATVSSDAVCSADSVKSMITNSVTSDYSNIAELSLLTPDNTPGNQGSTNTNTDKHVVFMTQDKSARCTDTAVDGASSAVHLKMAGTSPECMNAGDVEQKTRTSQPLAIICDADISVVKHTADDKPAGDETVMTCIERTEMFLQTSDSTTCNRSIQMSKAVSTIVTYTGSTESQNINEPQSEMYLPLSSDIPRGRPEAADSFECNEDGFVLVTSRRNRKQKKSQKIRPNDATSIAKDFCDGAQGKDSRISNIVHHEYLPCQIVGIPLSSSLVDKSDIAETALSSSLVDKSDIAETALSSSVFDKIDITESLSSRSVLDNTDIVETPLSSSVLDKTDIAETPLSSSVLDKTDIVETSSSSSLVDKTDIVETSSSSSVLDKTDIVETPLSSSVLDKTDIAETPLSSSVLDKTDIVETSLSSSLVDKTDIVETSSSSSVLDKTDIVETPLSSSVLDKTDIAETPLSSSVLDKTDIVETSSSSSLVDKTDIVETSSSSSVLDKTDIVETSLSSSLVDKTDIVETSSSSSVLDKTDIVETPLSSSVLDKTDIAETPLSSSVLDKTDIVETSLSSSLVDKTDIAETSSSSSLVDKTAIDETHLSSSLLDKTDIVETPSSCSMLVHFVNEKDETLTLCPISGQNSQVEKVKEKLPSVSMFSPSEPTHTDLHDAHICCVSIAPAVIEQARLEQTLSADEVQRLDNNRETSTGDLTMTEIMLEPETTVKPFVFNDEIRKHGVVDTNGKSDREKEPFEPAAEDCTSQEFICRMLEGIDAHTQEYGEEFLHSDECGGMLLNVYTAGHRRILKPHRRLTKPDHETTPRSGDNDSDFTDPVTELEEDQKSAEESTVAIGDLNVPADGTLVNRSITKEGKRRGKGHKRTREGINKVETPRLNSECSELNMSDDAGSIDASLEDLEHFGSDFSARLSDEDSGSESDKYVSVFDQHDNVSDGVNVIHQHLDSHVDDISAEITDIDHRHTSIVDAAADLDTKGWQTYEDSDTLNGCISVNESAEAEYKSTTDRLANNIERSSSDKTDCPSAHHQSEFLWLKESSDMSSQETKTRDRETDSVGNNDNESMTQESSAPIKDINDENVSCFPYCAEATSDAVRISLQSVELHQRVLAQNMLGCDVEASHGTNESCEEQGTMSNEHLGQDNSVDRFEAFINACAAVKVILTTPSHTQRIELADSREEVETAGNGPDFLFANNDHRDDLCCQSETGNPLFPSENLLKYTSAPNFTADLAMDSTLTNTSKSGDIIDRGKVPLPFNECVSKNRELDSDVSNNDDDVVYLRSISARIDTLLNDSEEIAHDCVNGTIQENADIGDSTDNRTEDVSVIFNEGVGQVQSTIAESRQGDYANVTMAISDEHLQRRPDASDTMSHCKEKSDTSTHTTCTYVDHGQKVTQADHENTTVEDPGNVQLKFSSEQEIVHLSDVIKEHVDNTADCGNDNVTDTIRLKIGDNGKMKLENIDKLEQRDDPVDGIHVTEESKIFSVEGTGEESDCEEQRRREDLTDANNPCRKTSLPGREGVFIGNDQNWRAEDMGNTTCINDHEEDGRLREDRTDNIARTNDQSIAIENRDIQVSNMNWRVEDIFDVKWESDEEDGSSRNVAENTQERKHDNVENDCEHMEIDHDQSRSEYIGHVEQETYDENIERENNDTDHKPVAYPSDTEMADLETQQMTDTRVATDIVAGHIVRPVEATHNVEWKCNNYNKNVYLPDLGTENLVNLAHKNENIKANVEWVVEDIDDVKWKCDKENEKRRHDPKIEKSSEDTVELTAEWRCEDINSLTWESDDEDQFHRGDLTNIAKESRKMSSACRGEDLIGDNKHSKVKETGSVKWRNDERRGEDLVDGIQEINYADTVLRKEDSITDTFGWRFDDIAAVKWQSDDEEDNVRNEILDRIQENSRVGGNGKTEDSVADDVQWKVQDIGHTKWNRDDEQQDDIEDVTRGTADCSDFNIVNRHERFIGDHVQWRIADTGGVQWKSREEKDKKRSEVAERNQECTDVRAFCRSDSLSDTVEWTVEDFGNVKWESGDDDNDVLRNAITDKIQQSVGIAADGSVDKNITDNAEWRVDDIGDVRWESDEEYAAPAEDITDRNKVLNDRKTVCRKYDFLGDHVECTSEDISEIKMESDETFDGEKLLDSTIKLQMIHSRPSSRRIEESMEGMAEGFNDLNCESIDAKEKCGKDVANRVLEMVDQSATHETIDMQTHINDWGSEDIGNVKYDNNEETVRHNISVNVVQNSRNTTAIARAGNCAAANEACIDEDSGALTLKSNSEETAKRSGILDIFHQNVSIKADGSIEDKVADTVEWGVEDIGDVKWENDKEEDGRQHSIDTVQEMNNDMSAHRTGEMRLDNNHWRVEELAVEQWENDDKNVDQRNDLEYRLQENDEENRVDDIELDDMQAQFVDNVHVQWNSDSEDRDLKASFVDGINEERNISPVVNVADDSEISKEERRAGDAEGVIWGDHNSEDGIWRQYQSDGVLLHRETINVCRKNSFDADNVTWTIEDDDDDMKLQSDVEKIEPREVILDRDQGSDSGVGWRMDDIADVKWDIATEVEEAKEDLGDVSKDNRSIRSSYRMEDFMGCSVEYRAEDADVTQRSNDTDEVRRCELFVVNKETTNEDLNTLCDTHADTIKWRVENNNDKDNIDGKANSQREDVRDTILYTKKSSVTDHVDWRFEDIEDLKRESDEKRRDHLAGVTRETSDNSLVNAIEEMRTENNQSTVECFNDITRKCDAESIERRNYQAGITHEPIDVVVTPAHFIGDNVAWRVEDIGDVNWESDDEDDTLQDDLTDRSVQSSLQDDLTDRSVQSSLQDDLTDRSVQSSLQDDLTDRSVQSSLQDDLTDRSVQSSLQADLTDRSVQSSLQDDLTDRSVQSSLQDDLTDRSVQSSLQDDLTDRSVQSSLQDDLTDRSVQSSTETVGYVTTDNAASKTFNSVKWQYQSDNAESTEATENQIHENSIEVALDMKLKTPDDIDSEICAGRSSGNRKFNGQNTAASVIASHSVHSTQHEDVTSQNDVSRNEQFQASTTEPAENTSSTRQPVAVGFTEAITHSPGSRSCHDCINSHMQFTNVNRPANHQTSASVDSEPQTSDISHSADCLVNNTWEHSSITGAVSCVNASVLLTDVDVELKTNLSESKQNRKKKHKKKNRKKCEKKNVQAQALEQAVNVKESFGEECDFSEVMGVAVAADKFSVHCSPDDSGRGESLRGLTAVLVVGSAETHSANTAAGSDDSVKLTDVCLACEHTRSLEMLPQCDVENNKTESKTESAAGEVDISRNDITKADPGELSSDDDVKRPEQATTNQVSMEHSADLLHVSTNSSLHSGCFSGLENDVNIRGDNEPTEQRRSSRSSFDKTLLEGQAGVSSSCHEDNAIAPLELATPYQTDYLPHQFVDRCETLLPPASRSITSKRLLEDVTHSKARAEQLVAQNTEASKRQNIREFKSSEEPTLTPAGHLLSEIGLLETSARDQQESLQVAVLQQHIYEAELLSLTHAIDEAQQKLQASPITAGSVSELRQLMTERTNLTEQIKSYKTQINEVNERIRQLALDSAQLSPSVFRKHYHPESAYSDYFAATSQHKRGAVPFHTHGQLFYDSLPDFHFLSTSNEELPSSLARNSRDELDNWKQPGHQNPVIGVTPISRELPRLIPPPRTDSIPRPTWSGEIMSTAASLSDMSRGTSVSHSKDTARIMSRAVEASASSSKSIGSVLVSTEQTREGYTSTRTTEDGPEIIRAIDAANAEATDSSVGISSTSVLHGDTYSSPTIDSEASKPKLPATNSDQQAHVYGRQTEIMHTHGSVRVNNASPNNWNSLSVSDPGTDQSPSTQRMLATIVAQISGQYKQDASDTEGHGNQTALEAGTGVTSSLPTAGKESQRNMSGEMPHEQDAKQKKQKGDLVVEAYRKQVDIQNWLGKHTGQTSSLALSLDEHATLQTQLLENKDIQEQISKHLQRLSDLLLECDSLSDEDPITARKLQDDLLVLQRDLEKAQTSATEKQFMLEAVISDTVDSGTGREDELGQEIRNHIQLINEIADQGRHPASSESNITDAEVRDSWQRLSNDLAQRTENLECILRTQKPEDLVKICLHAPAKSADSTRELENVTKLIADLNSAWILQQTQLNKKQLHPNEALTLQRQHQSVIQNISDWLDLAEQQLFTVPLSTEEQVRHNENLRRQIHCLQDNVHGMNKRAVDHIESTGSANRELIKICHSRLNDRLKMIDTTTKLQAENLQQTETQWKQYHGEVNNLQRQLQDIQKVILLPTATQSLDQLTSNTQQTEVRLKMCETQLQELRMTESSLIQKYPKGVFISELVPLQSKYTELHRKAVEKKSTTQNLVTFRDQYKKMLKDCTDFLKTAEYKLGADSISAKDLIDLKQQLATFKEFFSDIDVHKATLDSLASNCDPSTRIQFQQQHADLSARIHVLVDQASLHGHRLERLTRQWADLEDKYSMLQNMLLSLEAQMPKSVDSEDSLTTIQDKSNKYKWLQEELSANRDSVFEVVDKGKQILHIITCPSLDTAITELQDKWVSLNGKLTQELKRTESLCDLLSMFETELAVLSSWLATAKIKLEGFRNLSAASLQNISVVRREVEKILEFRKEVANQVLLKNKVMNIGNQLLKNKTYDTRGLSKKLQDCEEEWKQLEQGIADTQEHLLQVQMKLMPSRQALKELTDWIGEMSKSLENDAGFVTKTPLEIESMVKKYKNYQTELASRQMSMDFVNQMVLVPQATEVNVSHEKLEFAENLKELNKQWKQVTKEVKDKLNELEDVHSKWDEYEKAVKKLQSWCHQQEVTIQSYQRIGNNAGVEQTLRNCNVLQQQLQCKQTELAAARTLGHHLIELSHDFPSQQLVTDSLTALDHNLRRLDEHTRQQQGELADILDRWNQYRSDLADLSMILAEAEYAFDHYKLIRGDITTLHSQVVKLKDLRARLENKSDQLKSFSAISGQLRHVCEPSVQVDIQKTESDLHTKWSQLSSDLIQRCNEYEHYLDEWQLFENQYSRIQDWLDAKEALCIDLSSINTDSVNPETLTKCTQLQRELDSFESQVSDLHRQSAMLTTHMNPSTVSIMKSRQSAIDQRMLALKQMLSKLSVTMSKELSMREKFKEIFEDVKKFLSYAEFFLDCHGPVKAANQDIQLRFEQLSNLLLLFSSNCKQLDEVNDLGYQLALDKIDASRLRELNHKWYKLYEDTKDGSRTLQGNLLQQQNFTSKCEAWKTFVAQTEHKLAEKVKGNLDDLSDQLCNIEQFENELYSQQQIIHAIRSDGQRMISAGEVKDKNEFQRQINLLFEQWQSVSTKANQKKAAIEEIKNKWHVFNTLSQSLKDWLIDTENYLEASPRGSNSLQVLRNFMEKVQAVKHEFQVQEATYNKILDLGRDLLQHADGGATKEIEDTLSLLQHKRHKVLSTMEEQRLQTEDLDHQWVRCESEVDDMLCQLTEIRSILNTDIPTTYDELQVEVNRCKDIEKEFIESKIKEQSLLTKKEQLARIIQTEDMSLLQQRIQLLTKQREELQHQTRAREDKITDALFRWTDFNKRLKLLVDWIEDMTIKISNQDMSVEDLLAKLENEFKQETESKEIQKALILEQGRQLVKVSDNIRASEIEQKLKQLEDKWQHLKRDMDTRLFKLRETVIGLKQLDTGMSSLSQWLSAVERVLNEDIMFSSNDPREVEAKLQDNQVLQQDIEHHAESVSSLLSLCQKLLNDSDACPTETEILALQHSRKNLEKRWQAICEVSRHRKTRIEETWKLWMTFQDGCGKFSEWITQMEQEVGDSGIEALNVKTAKICITKYENLQRNIHDHLSDLEHINRTYCQLVMGCTVSHGVQKDMMTKLNERWDVLLFKVTEIMRKLCSSSIIREDFETTRISLEKWLRKLNNQLTSLQNATAPDLQARLAVVQDLDAEIYNKRHRIEYLDQAGVHLMQKADSQEALRVQRELDEFKSFYKTVQDRLNTIKLCDEYMPFAKAEGKSTTHSSEDRHQQLDADHTRKLQNVSEENYAVQIAGLEEYLEGSPSESPAVRQKSHAYNGRGSVSPLRGATLTTAKFESDRKSQSPSFLRSRSPTLKSMTTRSVSPRRRSPSQRSPTRSTVGTTGQTKINVLMEQLAEALKECNIKLDAMEQTLEHFGDTEQSIQTLAECESAVDYVQAFDRLLKTETGLLTIDSVDTQVKSILQRWEFLQKDVKCLRLSQEEYDLAEFYQDFLSTVDYYHLWLENTETQVRHCEPVNSGVDQSALREKYAKLQELQYELIKNQTKIVSLKETADQMLKNTELPECSTARDKIYIVHKRVQALSHLITSYITALENRLKTPPKRETHHDSFDATERKSSGIGSSYTSRSSTPLESGSLTLRTGNQSSAVPRLLPPSLYSRTKDRENLSTELNTVTADVQHSKHSDGLALLKRVIKAALPILLLLLLLWLLFFLIPACEDENSCMHANSLKHSVGPMLRYTDGAPPV